MVSGIVVSSTHEVVAGNIAGLGEGGTSRIYGMARSLVLLVFSVIRNEIGSSLPRNNRFV